MESIAHLKWRYAVKKFDSRRLLPNEKVEGLKHAFNLTATSYGLQPIKMVVLQNKEIQKKLVSYSYGQRQVENASHVLVICIEKKIDTAFIKQYFNLVKEVRGTEETILKPFEDTLVQDFGKKETEEIKIWATNQAYLALGNLLSYCALEEIDSCPMEGFVPGEYDKILGLGKMGLTSVLVLPVGYRSKSDPFSKMEKVRKNIEESIIEIFD
ncbi:nitroreductase family protein [Maribacter sp. ANRC-HE7]|uniref:Nitroreductase family protein n=1 Tax=Maribacter aquimaris TaxID=2737171 RepID=A0ABR7UZ12_9FLAO|nr:nitroreductase family protein [Maribacter aquimaris]MBD0777502.1 nitroreductase family protein [Maribacter aquimaris]